MLKFVKISSVRKFFFEILLVFHTSYISENNLDKIQSLAVSIFDMKMMLKSNGFQIFFGLANSARKAVF